MWHPAPLFLLLLLNPLKCQAKSALFIKSTVESSRLAASTIQKTKYALKKGGFLGTAMTCNYVAWENYCVTAANEITATNLLISGGITDKKSGDKIPCYTTNPRVAFPSNEATFTGAPHFASFSKRTLSNLEDGVYGFDINECFFADYTQKFIHMVIDFKQPRTLTTVKMRNQNSGKVKEKFNKIEVRAGDTAPIGNDMSNLKLIGTFDGPTTDDDIDIDLILTAKEPFVGRFVSIQEAVYPAQFQVCHLEVY